jgi:hypothetical protein
MTKNARTPLAGITIACLMLAACGHRRTPEPAPPTPAGAAPSASGTPVPAPETRPIDRTDWRGTATAADRARIRDWYVAWQQALADARAHGYAADIAAEGALLDPTAGAPDRPLPPPGNYRCRIIKVGAKTPEMLSYVAYPAFRCRIAANREQLSFAKLTGSQRQVGTIWPDTAQRGILLGTLVLGDERRPLPYGTDDARNIVGLVERIGENRWRITFPRPAFESITDVMELVPEG